MSSSSVATHTRLDLQASESLHSRRQLQSPPPINSDLSAVTPPAASSPTILREFDRYPAARNSADTSVIDNVSMIMKTAVSAERYEKFQDGGELSNDTMSRQGGKRSSKSSADGPRLQQATSSGSVPGPGSNHGAGSGSSQLNRSPSTLSRSGTRFGFRTSTSAPGSGKKSSLPDLIHSGKISISSPEGFSHVSTLNEYRNRPISTRPIVRDQQQQQQQQQQHKSPAESPSSVGPPVLSYAESKGHSGDRTKSLSLRREDTVRDSRRASIFPWRKSNASASSNVPLPQISEPILEASTSQLVAESLPRHHEATSRQSDPWAGPASEPKETSRNSRSQTSPQTFEKSSVSSDEDPLGNSRLSIHSQETDMSHYSSMGNFSTSSPTQKGSLNVTAVAPTVNTAALEYEMTVLRQKLKESEDGRRNVMIDYSKKLDAERKKTLSLERRLEQMMQDRPKNSLAPGTEELQTKIKSLESQRSVLREALTTLRRTKDLEITELRTKVPKRKQYQKEKRADERGDDQFHSRSFGINPLLPFTTGPSTQDWAK